MKKVECKECKRVFTDKPGGKKVKVFQHEGELLCEECLVGKGYLPPHTAADHAAVVQNFSILYYND